MPQYKVLKRGFIDGALRDPDGKHDPYITRKPLNPIPSWLELIDEPKQPAKTASKPATKAKGNTAASKTAKRTNDNPPAGSKFDGKVESNQVKFKDNLEVI